MMIKKLFQGLIVAALMYYPVMAAEGRWELPEDIVVKPHFYGYLSAGQLVKGNVRPMDIDEVGNPTGVFAIDHLWNEDAVAELGFDAVYREHLKLGFTLGAKLYFSYPIHMAAMYTKNMRQDVYIGDLYAQYHFGEAANPFLLGEVGYFKFKYNPDGRNFGDYLFRTGTYPIWFNMSFDNPWQRLLGFHVQSNLFNSLKLDALLVSETIAPAMDWSLAGIADYDVAGLHFINIGAGVDFAHLLSVYSDHYNIAAIGGSMTTPKVNTAYNIEADGDTLWYTFKGTKVMGRVSIDPKVFLPFKNIFGESDLKLYAEADIIGLKSYPDSGINTRNPGTKQLVAPSYDKLFEKMPVAVGFNVPTFKIFDVLNGEMEWFAARYYNDASNQVNYGNAPVPYYPDLWFSDQPKPKKSFLKWSIYAKKSFSDGHFAITGQIGRDHMRLPSAYYHKELWNELLVTEKDWAWYLKTSWMF